MDVRSGIFAILGVGPRLTDGIVVEGTEFGGGVEHDGKIMATPLTPGPTSSLGARSIAMSTASRSGGSDRRRESL
jgi:hypothetical protein